MHFHEHAVHAGRDTGRGQRLDELRLAGRDAVAAARELQAVRDVVDDGAAERAQHRKGAHVHDEVVVAERETALGDDDARIAARRDLLDRVPHVERAPGTVPS